MGLFANKGDTQDLSVYKSKLNALKKEWHNPNGIAGYHDKKAKLLEVIAQKR
jgi:hypothetical protein